MANVTTWQRSPEHVDTSKYAKFWGSVFNVFNFDFSDRSTQQSRRERGVVGLPTGKTARKKHRSHGGRIARLHV